MLLEDDETQTPARKTLKLSPGALVVAEWHLPDSTLRTRWKVTRDHRARLVWTTRDFFAYYNLLTYLLTSLHFWNSLDVHTRGILRCLLGSWPLGQNPAGAKTNNRILIRKSTYRVEQHWNKSGIPFFLRFRLSGSWLIAGLQLRVGCAQSSGHSTYQPFFRH